VKPTEPTTAQKAEMETRERVYKVVRLGTQGRHVYSALAGLYGNEDTKGAECIQYDVGKVSVDVDCGEGIFIYLDKNYAIEQANKMALKVDGRQLKVYSAKPIGEIVIPAGKSKTAICDGLMLVEIAKVIPTPKKPPTWQEVPSKDVSIRCRVGAGGGVYALVYVGDLYVAEVRVLGIHIIRGGFRVTTNQPDEFVIQQKS